MRPSSPAAGKARGQSIVMQLAAGELSTRDFDEHEQRVRSTPQRDTGPDTRRKNQHRKRRRKLRRVADQLDNRPVFTIVMGCNGAGKSAWKRANQDRLPERYFDKLLSGLRMDPPWIEAQMSDTA